MAEEQVNTEEQQQEEQQTEEKTFTQEELDNIIQDRLARQKDNFEKSQKEVEKLKKLNADQKKDYEIEKANKAKDQALAELTQYKLMGEARKTLEGEGISVTDEDLNLLVTPDADSTNANVKQLIDFKNRVSESVTKELTNDKTPIKGRLTENLTDVSQEKFDSMTYEEKADLMQHNPEQFNKLIQGGN